MVDILEHARTTLAIEVEALQRAATQLTTDFCDAVNCILQSDSHVIVLGVGKSGIIGKKIAATLASTGTPSFFIHPTEAFHGDLGAIRQHAIVLMISYSGETKEVIQLLPTFKNLNLTIIALTGNKTSTLAQAANFVLDVSVEKEACPHNLAPTASIIATLGIGDALAMTLMQLRGFTSLDFAVFHPGGSLGKKLTTKVTDAMHTAVPVASKNTSFFDCIAIIDAGKLGLVVITEEDGTVSGIITDGDIRRALNSHKLQLEDITAQDLMNTNPKSIQHNASVYDGEEMMRKYNIHALIVLDESTQHALGILQFS